MWGGTTSPATAEKTQTISIHPPRVGWDGFVICDLLDYQAFQSTHPVWGGTTPSSGKRWKQSHFNPPTPCGVGPKVFADQWYKSDFNPPTPCGVGPGGMRGLARIGSFQSTHPVWGGTNHLSDMLPSTKISIHPPRVGWDSDWRHAGRTDRISIHPPRVGWDDRGEGQQDCRAISIHPPRVGWDARKNLYI